MAVAFRCDRCLKYFLPDEENRIKKIKTEACSPFNDYREPINENYYDICNDCYESLNEWFINGRSKESC